MGGRGVAMFCLNCLTSLTGLETDFLICYIRDLSHLTIDLAVIYNALRL